MATIGLTTAEKLRDLIELTPKGISIIDARDPQDYQLGHVPGAVNSPWQSWSALPPAGTTVDLFEPGWWGVLGDPRNDNFAEKLEKLGISNDRPAVIYADGWISNGREGRLAWMLAYLGIPVIRILNGGWRAWLECGGQVERTTARPTRGRVEIRLNESRRLLLEQVRTIYQKGNPILIDTRTAEEFSGVDLDDPQTVTGHMPRAINIPYARLFNPDGSYIDGEAFRALLPQELWQRQLISYCEVGVKAGTFAALCEIHLGKLVSVFDGSIREWAECPQVETVREPC